VASEIRATGKSAGLVGAGAVATFATVLWTASAILFGLWAMGVISGGSDGPWVHLLLAFALLCLVLATVTSLPRRTIRE